MSNLRLEFGTFDPFYVLCPLQVFHTCISTLSNDITNNAIGFESIFPKQFVARKKKTIQCSSFFWVPFDCQPCLVRNPVGFVLVIVNNVIFRFVAREKKNPFFIGASMFRNTDIFSQKRRKDNFFLRSAIAKMIVSEVQFVVSNWFVLVYYIKHYNAYLLLKTSTKFRVDKVGEEFFQIFDTLLNIINFIRVIDSSRQMTHKPR